MIPCKNAASAVAGRTARACDNCVRRRARWFCAADDAFLCPPCDASVHSANTLARRHHRVRLKAAPCVNSLPAWHRGFTRKPRTPRHGKPLRSMPNLEELVPELGAEEATSNDNELEHLLYRVPSLDPSISNNNDSYFEAEAEWNRNGGHKAPTFLASEETDLTEFAANVEVLLGKGLEDECFGMDEMGFSIFNAREENDSQLIFPKVEDEESEPYELGVDDCEPKRVHLRLDYAAVIVAWEGQGSPWLNGGERPEIDPEQCLISEVDKLGGIGKTTPASGDGGREARVTRYREKRRTRLFAKKIRYEVRKLNAEKRPRMKGRFVKRASFLGPNNAAAGVELPLSLHLVNR